MHSVDVSVLLHACFDSSPEHRSAISCLETCRRLPGGLSVLSSVAATFIRLATDRRVYREATLQPAQALTFLDALLVEPGGRIVHPGRGHWTQFVALVAEHGSTRSDVTDAWLAAAALDSRATWYSFDRGFARYRGLRWVDPAAVDTDS